MATSMLQFKYSTHLVIFVTLLLTPLSSQISLPLTQTWSLLRIQHLLNYPPILKSWHSNSTFCNLEPNPHFTIVCYENSITQLHINGNPSSPPLPKTFPIESFVTTLTRFPDLKVISMTSLGLWGLLPAKIARLPNLEILNMSSNFLYGTIPHDIANLTNLQTLILDHNLFGGPLQNWVNSLKLLAVLSLKNNSLNGTLPNSLSSMTSLRIIDLSLNNLSGNVPDLSELTNLEVLDLGNNSFGPQFPVLGKKLVTIVLKNNKFGGSIPANLESYNFLQMIDVSSNKFVGPFPPSLFSLPSIHYINIAGNRFTGMLFTNTSCNDRLEFVDLSENLLSGMVPSCFDLGSQEKSVFYSHNCLSAPGDPTQHPDPFCQTQALAAGILPEKKRSGKFAKKAIVAICLVIGVILCALLVGILVVFISKRKNVRKIVLRPPRKLKENSGSSTGNFSLTSTDSRYISPTIKLGALGIPSYRTFTLEEIEAATMNFDTSSFIGECSNGQMYRGSLADGSLVAIRCLKLKKKQASINFKNQIETISKLRHRHLTSALGHCFEYYLDDSTVSRIFFIFEFVPNGNLRSNISNGVARQKLTWPQRISATIGVAKGIQFLHGGIIPGLYGNNLKISNVLLDQNFVAKISCYNLPVIEQSTNIESQPGGTSNSERDEADSAHQGEKADVYDFGVILLEILCGRPIQSHYEVGIMKNQLQLSLTGDRAARRRLIDPVVNKSSSDESLKTVMEICMRCLSKEPSQRPSVEDVLWNLQFAAQVLARSCESSPLTPSRPRRS